MMLCFQLILFRCLLSAQKTERYDVISAHDTLPHQVNADLFHQIVQIPNIRLDQVKAENCLKRISILYRQYNR